MFDNCYNYWETKFSIFCLYILTAGKNIAECLELLVANGKSKTPLTFSMPSGIINTTTIDRTRRLPLFRFKSV